MQQIIDRIFVGPSHAHDYAERKRWSIVAVTKEGEHSHRSVLMYTTQAAPHNSNYYSVTKGNQIYLNVLDVDNPSLIAAEAINDGLEFLKEHYEAGDTILIHCQSGISRSPTLCMMFLRTLGEFPSNWHNSENKMKVLYPKFDPQEGIRVFAQRNWRNLLYEGKTENV